MIRQPSLSAHIQPFRSGFTVVELLAATLLSVLLMTAVLGILQTISIGRKSLARDGAQEPWTARVIDLLQWDLANSRTIHPLETGFELDGFAGREFGTGMPIHCRSVIQYTLVPSGDRSCLLRTEIHPESLSLDNRTSDLVAFDVDELAVIPSGTVSPTDRDGKRIPQSTTLDGDLPTRLRVEIYRNSRTTPLLAHNYVLR